MTSRRDLIKTGLGLAGIILSRKAPASLVRSLVSAKESISQDANSWVNPYISDALVSMWDAEWNAGYGKHSPTTTTWFDCGPAKNDLVQDMSAPPLWEDKANIGETGVFHSMYSSKVLPTSDNSAATLEFCGCMPSQSSWLVQNRYHLSTAPTSFQIARYGSSRFDLVNGGTIFSTTSTSRTGNISFQVVANNSGTRMYIDGVIQKTLADNNSSCILNGRSLITGRFGRGTNAYPMATGAKNYCIRLHSRALTEEELAANYAIDKERFGL